MTGSNKNVIFSFFIKGGQLSYRSFSTSAVNNKINRAVNHQKDRRLLNVAVVNKTQSWSKIIMSQMKNQKGYTNPYINNFCQTPLKRIGFVFEMY